MSLLQRNLSGEVIFLGFTQKHSLKRMGLSLTLKRYILSTELLSL